MLVTRNVVIILNVDLNPIYIYILCHTKRQEIIKRSESQKQNNTIRIKISFALTDYKKLKLAKLNFN